MITVYLTEDDLNDLAEGATINTIDDNGDEHIIDGTEIGVANVDSIALGETYVYGELLLRSDQT